MPEPPLVLVTWRDHVHANEPWSTREKALENETREFRSVGWLLLQDDSRLVLVETMGEDEVCGSPLVLVASAVVSVAYLQKRR